MLVKTINFISALVFPVLFNYVQFKEIPIIIDKCKNESVLSSLSHFKKVHAKFFYSGIKLYSINVFASVYLSFITGKLQWMVFLIPSLTAGIYSITYITNKLYAPMFELLEQATQQKADTQVNKKHCEELLIKWKFANSIRCILTTIPVVALLVFN